MTSKIKFLDDIDCEWTDDVICPWCGSIYDTTDDRLTDDEIFREEPIDVECCNCGHEFKFHISISYAYSSVRKE